MDMMDVVQMWERLRKLEDTNIPRGKLGRMGGIKSHGCREHWRTSENAWDEILHNSISPLGPNPEVCAEKFLYIRWRKIEVGLQQNPFTFAALNY